MPRISRQEFEQLPLRVHNLLAGVPLHDVWAIDLSRVRPGITLNEFLNIETTRPFGCSPVVRALVTIRLALGSTFRWDREPAANAWETFASRMTSADRLRTLAPPGSREGMFRVVYRFENEQLLEVINRTAHAGALSALVETASSYRYYFGVYVCNVNRFTPVYMALIDPFRKLIVYPSILRMIRERWNETFCTSLTSERPTSPSNTAPRTRD
jgi:uncharacterized protein DUF2867